MSTWVKTFVDGEDCVFALIRDAILNGQFLGFVAVIEALAHDIINSQKGSYPENIDVEADLAALETNRSKFLKETAQALGAVETEAKRFGRSVLDMKRYVTGLSSTRMMCKIENAALMDSGSDLAGVVEQLDACQDEIEARLAKIVELNAVIQGNVSMLRSLL
jgi:aerotaxis receptor